MQPVANKLCETGDKLKKLPYCNKFNIAAQRYPLKNANAERNSAGADVDPARRG